MAEIGANAWDLHSLRLRATIADQRPQRLHHGRPFPYGGAWPSGGRLGGLILKNYRFLATSVAAVACAFATSAFADKLKIPEGTEVVVRFEEAITSATAKEGDRFTISNGESIDLGAGKSVPAGFVGAGEVTHSKKRKAMGQAGELNVRFDYIKVGDQKIRLRGTKAGEGDARVGTTVVLTVLFGPLGLLKKGKDIEINKGQSIKAYVDGDTEIDWPAPKPPLER